MRQFIEVDDWSEIDLSEALKFMPDYSEVRVQEPSDQCWQMWEEPVSGRVH